MTGTSSSVSFCKHGPTFSSPRIFWFDTYRAHRHNTISIRCVLIKAGQRRVFVQNFGPKLINAPMIVTNHANAGYTSHPPRRCGKQPSNVFFPCKLMPPEPFSPLRTVRVIPPVTTRPIMLHSGNIGPDACARSSLNRIHVEDHMFIVGASIRQVSAEINLQFAIRGP